MNAKKRELLKQLASIDEFLAAGDTFLNPN